MGKGVKSGRVNKAVKADKKPKYIKVLVILAAVVGLGVLAAVMAWQMGFFYSDNSVVANVNGHPITVREFKQRLNSKSTEVFSYFNKKYGAEDGENFWSTDFNGEIPNEVAKKKALDDCAGIKVQQVLAHEKGIFQDVNYEDFLKSLEQENKRREEAKKSNKAIYGPDQYDEVQYFSYLSDNMIMSLKEKLAEKELNPNEGKLKQAYENDKDTKYKIPDTVKIERISIPTISDSGETGDAIKQAAKARIEEVKARLDKGESFENLAKAYNKDGSLLEVTFSQRSMRDAVRTMEDVVKEAYKLYPGKTSGIIETRSDYCIIKCVEKKEMGYTSFDDAKSTIKLELIEKDYKQYIDKLIKEAKLEINRSIYDRITVR